MAWYHDISSSALRQPRIRGAVDLARRDPDLARVIGTAGPPLPLGRASSFELLARSIVFQQLSGKAATAIWGRLLARLGGGAPEPRGILRRRDATLRAVGLSWAKVSALKDLSRHVVAGRLDPDGLADLPDEEVVAAVTQVRGIGVWSAQMHLIFALGRLDVWPTGDLGVRKALARLRGLRSVPDIRAAERLGEPWRPWRTLAAWYLWRLLDAPDADDSGWEGPPGG